MKNRVFVICLFIQVLSFEAFSQDWKFHYDEAVKLYQQGNYEGSLASATLAYPLAGKPNQKSIAYTLQLITANYLQIENTNEGIQYAKEEVAAFLILDGYQSESYAEALKKEILLLQRAEKWNDAQEKTIPALAAFKTIYGEDSYPYASLLAVAGQLSIANKQTELARQQLQTSLTLLKRIPEAGEDYLNTLSVSADLERRLNEVDSAKAKYKKLVQLLEQNDLRDSPLYAETKKSLSELILLKNNLDEVSSELTTTSAGATLQAQGYLTLAIDYQQKNNVTNAFENYSAAKKIVTGHELKDNTAFSVYINSARFTLDQKKYGQASEDLAKAKSISQALFKNHSVENQIIELTDADLFLLTGNSAESIKKYMAAVSAIQAGSGVLPVSFVMASAKRLLNYNRPEIALLLLQSFVSGAFSKLLSGKEQLSVNLLYNECLIRNHQTDTAISNLTNAMKNSSNPQAKALYQLKLSEALTSKGAWNESLELLTGKPIQVLNAALNIEWHYQTARQQQLLGQYKDAEANYREAIKLSNGAGVDIVLQQQVMNSFATFYTAIGNYDEAERLYQQLLSDKTLGEDFRTTVIQNLAVVYEQTLRYDEAQKLLEIVVEMDAISIGKNHPDYALSLQNLASVYQKTNQSEKAKDLYNKAADIVKAANGVESLAYATIIANLGVVYMETEDFTKAQVYFQAALTLREKLLGKEHPDYVFNEYNLAVLHQRLRQVEKALPLYQHVSLFYRQQINELFPALSETEKIAYFNKINEVIQAYIDFAVETGKTSKSIIGELFNFRLATKALLLNSSTNVRNRILTGSDTVLKHRFTEWLQIKEELGKLYALNLEDRLLSKSKIEILQQSGNEIEKWLSTESEIFARASDREAATWQQIKSKLQPGEAAIEMIRLKLNYKNDSVIYAALVLKADWTQPAMVLFANGKALENREFKFYRNVTRFEIDNERSYEQYWKPLEPHLKDVETIYFSADGVYNKINLSSLFNQSTQEYLVDRFSFSLVSNLRELLQTNRSVSGVRSAALFGYPYFGKTSANNGANQRSALNDILNIEFQELPGTKAEIDKVGALLREQEWKVDQFMSTEASEEKIKQLKNVRILHIATHGFFVASLNANDPVVFSDDIRQAAYNPLLRSGLIFSRTEAKSGAGAEDGILTAYEAISLPLEQTEIVVLSACETGQGEVRNGEGVYGLQRAILLAGARHLFMSLWKVDDEATQELMVEFYKQWLQTKSLSQAYRNTQLALKAKYSMPYYWAGFVLLGI